MKAKTGSENKKTIWKNKLIGLLVAVVLIGGAAAWYFLFGPGKAAQTTTSTTPEYHTTKVSRGDLSISAPGTGTLVGTHKVDLNFSASGQVTELNVKVGDQVKTGMVLAKQAGVESLQANITNFQLQYYQALQSLETMQSNKDVTLANAYKTWITTKQTYNDSVIAKQRMTYSRCSDATNTQNASTLKLAKDQLDAIGFRYYGSESWILAEQKYETNLANFNYCITYTPDEKINAEATVNIADVSMKFAENNYNTLKANSGLDPRALSVTEAQVEQAMNQLQKAKKELEGATITSPIDGTVISETANQGAIVDNSTYIVVADMSHPTVQISLNETDLDKMVVGNNVKITFDALPGETFTGKITLVLPSLVASGQYKVVQGLVDLPLDSLKNIQALPLGLSAKVVVTSKESKNTLLVPIEALRDIGNKEYAVFVIGKDNKMRLTPVKVGLVTDSEAEILSGLNEGDTVTTGTVPTSNQG